MTKSVEKLIGAQIAKIRNDREITQERLSELINVTPETISRLERVCNTGRCYLLNLWQTFAFQVGL